MLGGGAIGVEMAQAFRRLGCEQVTVVEVAPRLLSREEPFAGDEVRAALQAEGVAVVLECRRGAGASQAVGRSGRGRVDRWPASRGDELLVAAGRRVATEELGLDTVGLTAGRFVTVDDQLRAVGVDGDWLYAVGDCNGRALLTHMGKYQARIAATSSSARTSATGPAADVVPRVTFTDPQVCAVGLTEAEARERGQPVRAVTYGTGDVAGAYTLGNGIKGTSKLVIDEARGVIVGATFTGPGVQELLHSATVAIAGEVPLDTAVARRAVVPDDQRGVAAPARDLRIVRPPPHA